MDTTLRVGGVQRGRYLVEIPRELGQIDLRPLPGYRHRLKQRDQQLDLEIEEVEVAEPMPEREVRLELMHRVFGQNGRPDARDLQAHVLARQEKAAAKAIEKLSIEVFLPGRIERHAWSDRIKNVELALFPGYLFIRTSMNAARRVQLLEPRQTVDLVGRLAGDDRIARHIPEQEIESLKTMAASKLSLDPVERLVKGTPVLVASGALKGARGIVEQTDAGKRRLVVQIELLGRGVSAQLAADDVVESLAQNNV